MIIILYIYVIYEKVTNIIIVINFSNSFNFFAVLHNIQNARSYILLTVFNQKRMDLDAGTSHAGANVIKHFTAVSL